MPPIKDSTVLIIGGSSGIGLAVASLCVEAGAKVHIASSNPTRLQSSIDTLEQEARDPNSTVTGHVCNLSSENVERDLTRVFQNAAPIDHIVYTAGDALAIRPLDNINLEAIHKAGHVRFAVPLLVAKLAPAYMVPGYRSSITLTTGSASEKPLPGWSLVAGYLTGLHGMTKSLAIDLKPLRVNLVSPGVVDTPMWGEGGVPGGLKEGTLLGKVGTAEEVAEAYIYLMRDSNATGSVVNTNGGGFLV
ncbi:oxidoreductase, short chain dehydrogenase/reductase family [Aspergillus stella-maris]|uniref:oxidoreductase, short chain dehydrogenase/reductase family n=1 Tax=Aspergillus stella-maris TaxID=1810926 RepID=UPI003CCDDBFB